MELLRLRGCEGRVVALEGPDLVVSGLGYRMVAPNSREADVLGRGSRDGNVDAIAGMPEGFNPYCSRFLLLKLEIE